MSQELYYTPPTDSIFEEMKKLAIDIWNTYDNTYWYADEKINKIKDIENVWDNFMYILAMFDCNNQSTLRDNASPELLKAIVDRLI